MQMNTKRKASGFFIVEILIVLLIVGILAVALLPNLTVYTQKAKFRDDIAAAAALKPAVEFCLIKNQSGTTLSTLCAGGAEGIPANIASGYGGYVGSTAVAGGVVTITSTTNFGASGTDEYTYILTPTITTNSVITWAATGTCAAQGLC